MSEIKRYRSLGEIKEANHDIGSHWFDAGTIKFWGTRFQSVPTSTSDDGKLIDGRYFITSEPYAWDGPRVFTVRRANPDGTIDTVGEMGEHKTKRAAIKAAYAAADADES